MRMSPRSTPGYARIPLRRHEGLQSVRELLLELMRTPGVRDFKKDEVRGTGRPFLEPLRACNPRVPKSHVRVCKSCIQGC